MRLIFYYYYKARAREQHVMLHPNDALRYNIMGEWLVCTLIYMSYSWERIVSLSENSWNYFLAVFLEGSSVCRSTFIFSVCALSRVCSHVEIVYNDVWRKMGGHINQYNSAHKTYLRFNLPGPFWIVKPNMSLQPVWLYKRFPL